MNKSETNLTIFMNFLYVFSYLILANWPNEYTVCQWSTRPGFNPR